MTLDKNSKAYEQHKENVNAREAEQSAAGRDIGDLPPVSDQNLKDECERDLRLFLEKMFPHLFTLEWSEDHLAVIKKTQTAILYGGLFAMAMPRGSGKTTIAECSAIWASAYGHREFTCLIGSDEKSATDMLDSIKMEYETNDMLYGLFPSVCYPIRQLEGIAQRSKGQLYKGKRTYISWSQKEAILPAIEGPACSAIIRVAGITGRIRGMKFKRPDGRAVRPSLVIPDDPQTDESASSLSQCATREAIMAGAVLGLAGPGNKIAGIMPCTVIRPGDMVDCILDRSKHPEWNGTRTRMVNCFPSNVRLWDEYAEIRFDGLRSGDGGRAATEFYKENFDAMNKDSDVAWAARFNHDELSALQNAMNLKLHDEVAFYAEYQNDPIVQNNGDIELIKSDELANKVNGIPKGIVPDSALKMTAFIDVQESVLWWMVVAWEKNYSGYVVDYGCFPDQHVNYVTMQTIKHNLRGLKKGIGVEAALTLGLGQLADSILGKEYRTESGNIARVDHMFIDEGYKTDLVRKFARRSKHSNLITTAKGTAWRASSKYYGPNLGKRAVGETRGLNWNHYRTSFGKRIMVDTYFWKTFVFNRMAVDIGDPGCISLYQATPGRHRMVSEQITAEFPTKTEGQGQTVFEWKPYPGRPDEHFLDCLVGCAACASMLGLVLGGRFRQPRKRRSKTKKSTTLNT